jgi:hypothetical protein
LHANGQTDEFGINKAVTFSAREEIAKSFFTAEEQKPRFGQGIPSEPGLRTPPEARGCPETQGQLAKAVPTLNSQ